MKVRAARPEDTATLLALRCALWPEREIQALERELRLRAGAPARHETLLVEDAGGGVCGFAELTRDASEPGQPVQVMLQAVFVAPPARRQGAAARLLVAAERWAHSRGARVLVCEVDATRVERHEALGWLGFAEPEHRVRLQRAVTPPVEVARESAEPEAGLAAGLDDSLPGSVEVPDTSRTSVGRRSVSVLLNLVLLGAALASFLFTDIYSPDIVRGVLLPLLDVGFVLYFITLFLVHRYRKRADSSARVEQLFRNEP